MHYKTCKLMAKEGKAAACVFVFSDTFLLSFICSVLVVSLVVLLLCLSCSVLHFLRDSWLECCRALSQINQSLHPSHPLPFHPPPPPHLHPPRPPDPTEMEVGDKSAVDDEQSRFDSDLPPPSEIIPLQQMYLCLSSLLSECSRLQVHHLLPYNASPLLRQLQVVLLREAMNQGMNEKGMNGATLIAYNSD